MQSGIRRMPQKHAVRVRVAASPESVAAVVGHWGTVVPDGQGCVLTMSVDALSWPVMVLAQLDADFVVDSPPELVDLVGTVGARFERAGRATAG